MESGACPPFIKPFKQDEDRDCELVPILSSKKIHLSISVNFVIYDSNKIQIHHQRI